MGDVSWVDVVGWISLGTAFACAGAIAVDELAGRRQQMPVMDAVHPITALYLGPVWLWAYLARGRRSARTALACEARVAAAGGADPDALRHAGSAVDEVHLRRWHVGAAVAHCGAGCTLGDIAGEWLLWGLGGPAILELGTFGTELVVDAVLAWSLGIVFQYLTIVPMRSGVGRLQGLWLAVRADTLSIAGFQLGLFAWMALSHEVLFQPPLPVDSSGHWWMMQVGMVVGYLTAWPVNRALVRLGWKEKMDRRVHLADEVERLHEHSRRRAAAW